MSCAILRNWKRSLALNKAFAALRGPRRLQITRSESGDRLNFRFGVPENDGLNTLKEIEKARHTITLLLPTRPNH